MSDDARAALIASILADLQVVADTSVDTIPHELTLPDPDQRALLNFEESYTAPEFDRIKAGLTSECMEDKWIMVFESPWLFMYRSWTGGCIFGVRFESSPTGVAVVESWVSRDQKQYTGTDAEYDQQLLKFLIDALLLKKYVSFPVPAGLPANNGIYQHAIAGSGYPEVVWPPLAQDTQNVQETHDTRSVWKRLRDRLLP